jgi:MEDS: MEthanogen/methylotroph, DcmR Sensory domain/Histidine kinase-like ATPase domain
VTSIRPTGEWDGSAFAHEAFMFGTDEELIDRVLPFAAEGLSRGEPVLVVAGERVRTLLAEELGTDLDRLAVFAAAEAWWRGGHSTLLAYDRDIRALRTAARSWRLAAEPVWLTGDDGREWSRFEAVANRCYANMPYYSLCLHDRQRLSTPVLDAVARTHPLTWGGDAPMQSAAYEDPQRFIRSVQPPWHERAEGASVETVVSPRQARSVVTGSVPDRWQGRVDDIVLATHELVTNSLRVSPAAELAFWTDAESLVVEVSDQGPGLPDETLGYVPPDEDRVGGRGLWLTWSLANDVAVASAGRGTQIRLYFSP